MNSQAHHIMRYLLPFLLVAPTLADDSQVIQPVDPSFGRPADFYQDVFPILEAKCLACHNVRDQEGSLVLENVPAIQKGGDSGPAIVAGKPNESLLYLLAARADEPVMPPLPNAAQAKPLTPGELGILKQWITEGAKPGKPPVQSEINWLPVPDHIQSVHALTLDPANRLLAAGRANRLAILDLSAQQQVAQLTDSALLAIQRDGQPLYQQGTAHQDFIHSVAFSPNGNLLASGGYRVIKLWERSRLRQLQHWDTEAPTSSLATNADGTLLATGHEDGKIAIRNLASGAVSTTLNGHSGPVNGISFLPGDEHIATSGADKTLRLWSVVDGSVIASLTVEQAAGTIQASSDGKLLITGHQDNIIRIWDVARLTEPPAEAESGAQNTPVREVKGHTKPVTALALIPNADEFASASEDGTVRAWNLSNGSQIRAYTLGAPVSGLSVNHNGTRIAAAGANGVSRIWEKANGKQLTELKGNPRLARDVQLRNDDLTIAKAKVTLADAEQKAADKDLKGREESLKKAQEQKDEAVKKQAEAQMKRDEEKARAEKATAEFDKNAEDSKLKKAKEDADKAFESAEDAFNKAVAAVESAERAIQLSEKSLDRAKTILAEANAALKSAQDAQKSAEQGQQAAQEAVKNAHSAHTGISFSVDGKQVALSTMDGRVDLRSSTSGSALESLTIAATRGIHFTTGGELVSISDQQVSVSDLSPAWTLVARLGPPNNEPLNTNNSPIDDRVLALAFSPDGRRLLSGGGEPSRTGELLLWDVETHQLVREIEDAHSDTVFDVEFSRDGRFIVSGAADKFVKLFNAESGEYIRSYEGHTNHVLAVSIKADESTIASGAADNEIKIWNRKTGEQKRTINNRYTKQVTAIDFIGVTDNTVSAGGDKSVRLITAANGSNFRSLAGMTDFVYAAVASRDQKIVAAGGESGVIRVWDGSNGKELMKFEPPALEQTTAAN